MLSKYGPIETKEWIRSSKLKCQTVELIKGDGFTPIGSAIGEGSYDQRTPHGSNAHAFFKDGSLSCRFWIKDSAPNFFGRSKLAPILVKGSGGDTTEVAYFVCFTDNVYIQCESITFWYSIRCIEN